MNFYFAAISLVLAVSLRTIAADAPPVVVPDDFLRTDSEKVRQVLDRKITADFRESDLREVLEVLKKQTLTGPADGLNIALGLEAGDPLGSTVAAREPVVTDHFENVPLRLVLYKLSLDTHLSVDWFYLPDKPHVPWGIRIHGRL